MDGDLPRDEPYRGLEPYRFCDRQIFFERETDAVKLLQLVTIYRGSLLYGESGTGKSSLVNAGLVPFAIEAGMAPVRLRVQPIEGHELVIERISRTGRPGDWLPSPLASGDETGARVVIAASDLPNRLRAVPKGTTPLLIFDQFEELVTLAAEANEAGAAATAQQNIVDLLVSLLRDSTLLLRILFVFREDYLARLDLLFYHRPELPDQFLRLTSPAADSLLRIIRGPFTERPGHWQREISDAVAGRLASQLAPTRETHRINLSQVQIVCLQLWRAADADAELSRKGVQGLVDDFLAHALGAFPHYDRMFAKVLLGAMITKEGTRKVISEDELLEDVSAETGLRPALIKPLLEALVDQTKLVRRDRHRQTLTYEIVSEFLVPWIRQLKAAQAIARTRKKVVWIGAAALLVLTVVAAGFYYWRIATLSSEQLVQAANTRAEEAEKQLLAVANAQGTDEKVRTLIYDVNVRQAREDQLKKRLEQTTSEWEKTRSELSGQQRRIAGAEAARDAALGNVKAMEEKLAMLQQRVTELTQKLTASQQGAKTTPAQRTATVEIVIHDHNGKFEARPRKVTLVSVDREVPDEAYTIFGGHLVASIPPGRWSVRTDFVMDTKSDLRFDRKANEAGTITLRPGSVDLSAIERLRVPDLSQLPADLRRIAANAYEKMSDDDRAHLLNVYARASAARLNNRPMHTRFLEVRGRFYNAESNALGIRIDVERALVSALQFRGVPTKSISNPTLKASFDSAVELGRMLNQEPRLTVVRESDDTIFCYFPPPRAKYVREDEILSAARTHQHLLANGIKPLFDLVFKEPSR